MKETKEMQEWLKFNNLGHKHKKEGRLYDSYEAFRKALELHEQVKKTTEENQFLLDKAGINYNLYTVGCETANSQCFSFVDSCCCLFPCCHYPQVDNREQHGQQALQDLDIVITNIKKENDINMNTNKDQVKVEVRKKLGVAYNTKGCVHFYWQGHYKKSNLYSNSNAAANFKYAKEWDPEDQVHESNYTKAIKAR